MKVTKKQLKQIIREELEAVISEGEAVDILRQAPVIDPEPQRLEFSQRYKDKRRLKLVDQIDKLIELGYPSSNPGLFRRAVGGLKENPEWKDLKVGNWIKERRPDLVKYILDEE